MSSYLLACILLAGMLLTACDKDDNNGPKESEITPTYNSLIQGFASPAELLYVRTDFNFEFIFDEDSRITGARILNFKVRPVGETVNHKDQEVRFNDLLESIGDTNAPSKIPEDAWDYLPLTKAIAKIGISPIGNDQLPDAERNKDCARYFEISYTSYYDYIQNGYSWNGIQNPGPIYKMSLDEFNKMDIEKKRCIDANTLTFHISPIITDNYTDISEFGNGISYSMSIIFEDGTAITKGFNVVDHYLHYQIRNYIYNYNLKIK